MNVLMPEVKLNLYLNLKIQSILIRYINIYIQILLISKKPNLNFMIEQWHFLYKYVIIRKTIKKSTLPIFRFYMKVIESTIHALPLWEIHKFSINVSDFVLSYKISTKTSADVGNMKEIHLPSILNNSKDTILKATLIFMSFTEINKIIQDSASKQINNLDNSSSSEIYGIKIDETHFSNTIDKSRYYKIRQFENQSDTNTLIQNFNHSGETVKPFKESKRKLRHPSLDVDLLNKIDLLKQKNELEENRAKNDFLDQSGKIQFHLKWKNQEILINDVGSPFYFEVDINRIQ